MQVWGKRTKPICSSVVCDLGTTYRPFFHLLPNSKGKSVAQVRNGKKKHSNQRHKK